MNNLMQDEMIEKAFFVFMTSPFELSYRVRPRKALQNSCSKVQKKKKKKIVYMYLPLPLKMPLDSSYENPG